MATNRNVNEDGEYALYDNGELIGYGAVDMVDGRKVLVKFKQLVLNLKNAAAKDGILLTLNSGFRTYDEQLALRIKYRKNFEAELLKAGKSFESKLGDETFMLNAPSTEFSPAVARPGWSNHQDGSAFDFMVRDNPNTKQNEGLAYGWLVRNAISHSFIRTVKSERWHWEYRPGAEMFSRVPKEDPSWDGLLDQLIVT